MKLIKDSDFYVYLLKIIFRITNFNDKFSVKVDFLKRKYQNNIYQHPQHDIEHDIYKNKL